MRYLTGLVGVGVAVAIYRYWPTFFAQLIAAPGWSAAIAGLAALLTSGWATALTKLASLEKTDDLNREGVKVLSSYAAQVRTKVIRAIVFNTLTVSVCVLLIYLGIPDVTKAVVSEVVGYLLCFSLGFWVGGLFESWSCFTAIEETRRALVEAQIETKKRSAYLAQLRKDLLEKPISFDDPHLMGYTNGN